MAMRSQTYTHVCVCVSLCTRTSEWALQKYRLIVKHILVTSSGKSGSGAFLVLIVYRRILGISRE